MPDFIKNLDLFLKIRKSKHIILQALNQHPTKKIAVAWTGGKDSTLLLWLIRLTCVEFNKIMPISIFIDEGSTFKEVEKFCKKVSQQWGIKVYRTCNTNVLKQVKRVGDRVYLKKLNELNRAELKRINFEGDSFPFYPESFVGNHLMKTVALNECLKKNHFSALFTGIRWDEHEARSTETYFSPRKNPDHTRVHPILHFTEKDVWRAINKYSIPYVSLYKNGFRSLGAKYSTTKITSVPAWQQDLSHTSERQGRQQDKEHTMQKLRNLGYM